MICSKCGWWERICHCRELNLFTTTKDKLYEFTDLDTFGKPVEVRGKGHWRKLLKQKGLHDDVKQAPRGFSVVNKDNSKPVPKAEIAKAIWSELKDRGLNDKVLRRR